MKDITKKWPYPKGLKRYIYDNTDFKTNKTLKINRFVSCIEMIDGKLVKRVFGYLSKTKERRYKDLQVKEVARYYNHNQYLGGVYCNYMNGLKYCIFGQKDSFYKYNKHIWWFDDEMITDINQFLIDNNLRYTGWEQYKGGIGFTEYITTYLENPKIELLVKAGLDRWVKYLKYLDTSKKSIHEIFKIKQDCVHLLYDEDFNLQELFMCRQTNSNDLNYLRRKVEMKYKLREIRMFYRGEDKNILEILKQEQTIKYLATNKIQTHDYIDYLNCLLKLGAITDAKVHYPKRFKKTHDEAYKNVKIAESKQLIEGFIKSYNKHKKYIYENSNYLIKPVKEPVELYTESEKLNHCVRTYDTEVSNGETEIFFIRKIKQESKPFYTLELKRKKIIQVRGKDNKNVDRKVKEFVETWANKYRIRYNEQSFV